MSRKKTEKQSEKTEDAASAADQSAAYVRGQRIKISQTDDDAIFLKMVSDTAAKVVTRRNQFEVIEIAVLDQFNKL